MCLQPFFFPSYCWQVATTQLPLKANRPVQILCIRGVHTIYYSNSGNFHYLTLHKNIHSECTYKNI